MFKKRILSNLLLFAVVFGLVPVNFASAAPWGTGGLVETDNAGSTQQPSIVFGPNGTALAVWKQSDGTVFGVNKYSTYANKYDGSSWGTPELLESLELGDVNAPELAVNASGKAIAVWLQFDGSKYDVYANTYNGSAWAGSSATLIESLAGTASSMDVDIYSDGTAIAVWTQHDGTRYNTYANVYDGSSWGTAGLIESSTGDAVSPQIAFDTSGNAIAVWYQSDGTRDNIWANKYNGTVWGTAELIESDNSGNAWYPQIDFDGSGNAIAVWEQSDGTRTNIWSNIYSGSSWGTAALIESDNAGAATFPKITVDADGKGIAVWSQSDGTRTNIWSNIYSGSSWGTAALIETNNAGSAVIPEIAFSSDGSATAVWMHSDGSVYNIWSNRYNGSSWGTAEDIQLNTSRYSNSISVAGDISGGDALALWTESSDTVDSVWSNKYTSNAAPVLSSASVVAPNGNGDVNISVVVNDDNDDNLTVSYYYEAGACSSYSSQPASTLRSASDGAGSVTVSSGTATSVATTSADNTLVAVWDTVADIGDTRGDYCVYIIANDGTVDSNEVSATVNISGSGGGSSSDDNTQGTAVGADVSENGEDLDGDHVEDAQSIEQVTETNTEDPTTTEDQQSIEQPQTDTSTETSNQSNDDDNQPIPEKFTDTAGTWAQSYIEKLRESGIVVGSAESTKTVNGELVAAFEPDAVVTRGQLVKMAMKAFGYSIQKFDKTSFTDVPTSHDFAMYIESAKQAGYISGYSDGTFRPDEAVNRAEALVIILKFSGLDLKSEGKIDFPDVASRAWYRDILAYAVEHKIISGYENGNFGPGDSLTRSQAAKILVLVMERG